MVFNSVVNNFISGEWSPKMLTRTDTEQYPRAAREITNGFVRPQGGVFRRPGFARQDKFTYDLTGPTQIVPYIFRGIRYAVFFTPSGPYAVNADTWTDVGVTVSASTSYPLNPRSIRHVQIGETLFLTRDDGRVLTLTYNFNVNTLFLANYDEFYTAFNKQAEKPWVGVPFGPVNADGIGGTITITGTLTAGGSVTLASTNDLFTPAMEPDGAGPANMIIKITSGGNTAAIKIVTVTSATGATGIMMSAKSGSSPLTVGSAAGTAYEMAAWNGRDGYPTSITAIQNRLVFGMKEKVYFTRVGNYYDLMEIPFQQDSTYTAYASDGSRPFAAAPFSTGITSILELVSAKTLIILTDNSEIVGYGGSNGISALPGGFIVESSSSFGTKKVTPVRVNNFVTFAQAIGSTVRDLTFNWELSQYKSMDLSFPAEHLLRRTDIVHMATSEADGSHLWVLCADGSLVHCSIDRDYSITAWNPVKIKGWQFKAIGVIKADGLHSSDIVLAIVSDMDDANHQIVQLAKPFEEEEVSILGPFPEYMDLFEYKARMTPGKDVEDLDFFEGMEVQVIADGFYGGKHTVVGGKITLGFDHALAIVGLPSVFRLETMPVEAGAKLGDATGKSKRVDTVYIRLFNTLGARYGCPQTGEYYDIPMRDDSEPMNLPTKMKSRDYDLSFPAGYSKVATVAIESDYPFPCNVLGIGIQGLTNE